MRWEPEALALSALVKQQAATAIRWLPEANPLRQAMPLARENRHSLAADLGWPQAEQGWIEARLLAVARVNPQELRLRRAGQARFPALPARVRRYSPGPDPSAFFREKPIVQKCNLAARYGDRPISAQYRPPRTRRALAGCDNNCSRSQRKHARRARPFPIVAGDKRLCRPLPFAD
jgi:hypothetical protein